MNVPVEALIHHDAFKSIAVIFWGLQILCQFHHNIRIDSDYDLPCAWGQMGTLAQLQVRRLLAECIHQFSHVLCRCRGSWFTKYFRGHIDENENILSQMQSVDHHNINQTEDAAFPPKTIDCKTCTNQHLNE